MWRGAALVSLVGFRFLETRVLGAPIPFHRNFDEINLRFYVRPEGNPEARGVVFIREFVPRRAISVIANTLYGENYATAAMRHEVHDSAAKASACYAWKWRRRENFFAVEARGEPAVPPEESAEAFIFEHYWGYGRSTYRVEHPRWRTYPVTGSRYQVDGDDVYGTEFGEVLARPPVSAMLAEGSAVTVYRPEPADRRG